MVRLKICTPYYSRISCDTCESVKRLESTGLSMQWATTMGTYISRTRNSLIIGRQRYEARPTLEGDWTHYLHLDSDIGFEPSHVMRLLDHDAPIVSGAYTLRGKSDKYTAGPWTTTPGDTLRYIDTSAKGLQRVDWVGAGFLLVKREVFEKMEQPWFRCSLMSSELKGVRYNLETGEDQGFCMYAQEHGYDILLDCDCVVRHNTNREGGETMAKGKVEQPMQPQQGQGTVVHVDKIIANIQRGLRAIGADVDKLSDASLMMIQQNNQDHKTIEELTIKVTELQHALEATTKADKELPPPKE